MMSKDDAYYPAPPYQLKSARRNDPDQQWRKIYAEAYEREWDRMLAEIAEYRDEIDNGDPGVVARLNAALAEGGA